MEYIPVCGIFRAEGLRLVLYAQHDEWGTTIVTHGAFAFGRHADNASLLYIEDLAVYLELALAAQEEVQFLMVLMGVEESGFRSRLEHLEREFAASRPEGRAAEHFARDFDFRSHFQHILAYFVQRAYVDGLEILF